jgi:hypothetical protein
VSFLLFVRHLAFLDGLSNAAHVPGTRALSRADILRAVIDALEDSRVTLAPGSSAEELRRTLADRWARTRR